MVPKKDPTKKLLRKQERRTRRAQRKYERQSKKAMRERMSRRYQDGGRGPGGFLSSTARGGFGDPPKSYYPQTYRYDSRRGGTGSVGYGKGYSAALKEMLEIMRIPKKGGGRKLVGLPTGRDYFDYAQSAVREDYKDKQLVGRTEFDLFEKKDDIEKTFDLDRRMSSMTPKGGRYKSVEIGGKDLNWFQRNFPRLLMERYKVKQRFDPEGELIKRVTTSRTGGRQVERFPTRAELDAMIAEDIRRAQMQNGE